MDIIFGLGGVLVGYYAYGKLNPPPPSNGTTVTTQGGNTKVTLPGGGYIVYPNGAIPTLNLTGGSLHGLKGLESLSSLG